MTGAQHDVGRAMADPRKGCACCAPKGGAITPEPAPAATRAATATAPASALTTIDLPLEGMCRADEATQVEATLGKLPGVRDVRAVMSVERATVTFDPHAVTSEQASASDQPGRLRRPPAGPRGDSPRGPAGARAGPGLGHARFRRRSVMRSPSMTFSSR